MKKTPGAEPPRQRVSGGAAGLVIVGLAALAIHLAVTGQRGAALEQEGLSDVLYTQAGQLHWREADLSEALTASRTAPEGVSGWRAMLFGERLKLAEATWDDLVALPGVGPRTAGAILDTREAIGGFEGFEDLERVPGIASHRLALLRPWFSGENQGR